MLVSWARLSEGISYTYQPFANSKMSGSGEPRANAAECQVQYGLDEHTYEFDRDGT